MFGYFEILFRVLRTERQTLCPVNSSSSFEFCDAPSPHSRGRRSIATQDGHGTQGVI